MAQKLYKIKAATLEEAYDRMRKKFGEDWYANRAVGQSLKEQLFAPGTSLSAEDVAARMGFGPKVDFQLAARRAKQLVADADALEKAR